MDSSSSSPSAGEDTNVCLRFSLGPTNLGILRPHLDVMKEQLVVIEQRDFRFDVYGRPADVASAIAYSFLGPSKNADHTPPQGGSTTVPAGVIREPRQPFSVVHTGPGLKLLSSLALTRNDQRESDTAMGRITVGKININDDATLHGSGQKSGYSINTIESSTSPTKTPSSPEASTTADVVSRRLSTLEATNWKTDYDLAWERSFGTQNKKEQAEAEIQELKPWSVTILLSMPFRVIQYLMLTSHGFKTYLVEEPDLNACSRQGISQERLKLIAQQAGMVVAINNVKLPSLESNPEESLVWLQLNDRKALRAVLLGVGKALAQEPVLGVIQKGLGQDELGLRKSWDETLDQTSTSGTTPNEREWVMDTPTSGKENIRSAESVHWIEPLMEDRPQRRRPTERARHPLAQRMSSPNKGAENRRRSDWDAWNSRLTEEQDRWDATTAGVDRSRGDKPSMVAMDPWTTTTSQSVGSFFTESEHHGTRLSVDSIGVGTSNSSSSDHSQVCGRSSRSKVTTPKEPPLQDEINNNNGNNNEDPWVTTVTSCEDTESLEPAVPSVL